MMFFFQPVNISRFESEKSKPNNHKCNSCFYNCLWKSPATRFCFHKTLVYTYFFDKQLVYKQLALISQSNNKNYGLKESGLFSL